MIDFIVLICASVSFSLVLLMLLSNELMPKLGLSLLLVCVNSIISLFLLKNLRKEIERFTIEAKRQQAVKMLRKISGRNEA